MRGELLDIDTGQVIAFGDVTLSRDGGTGVIELDTSAAAKFDDGRSALLRLAADWQLEVVIAETVPPLKRVRGVRFRTTIWFRVRRQR